MKELHTSLLREKFVIHTPEPVKLPDGTEGKSAVIALSNRIEIPLVNAKGIQEECITVRAHTMAMCVRMAARILQSYVSGGPLLSRSKPYDWDYAWETALDDYEKNFNPIRWVAIYSEGKSLFAKGEHHALLDVIEKCQATNNKDYDHSIPMAEKAINGTGQDIRIEYDGNVALAVHLENPQTRFGVIVRGPSKTMTFNFAVTARNGRSINYPQCLGSAAAFLEGIQLCYMVGMNEEKIRLGLIERHSREEKQTREARTRLGRLNAEISTLEGGFEVRYRPERPEFQWLLMDAEKLAKAIFAPKNK